MPIRLLPIIVFEDWMSADECFDDDVINVVPYVLHIVAEAERESAVKSTTQHGFRVKEWGDILAFSSMFEYLID